MKRCNSKVFSLMLVLCFESDQWQCQTLRPPSPKETPSAATDALTTTVNASIPIINWGMKSSFSLTTSVTGTYARKNTNENTETIKFPILVPTKSKVRVTVTMGECDLNINYVGRIVMETTDGVELSFPVRGTYEGVTQTDISVSLVLVKKPRKWRKFIG